MAGLEPVSARQAGNSGPHPTQVLDCRLRGVDSTGLTELVGHPLQLTL